MAEVGDIVIRYRLDDLGWFQFEWLCQSLLKTEFGVGIEAWGGHSDLGRDAYCEEELEIPIKGTKSPGPFLFQAKFVAEANAAGAKPNDALTNSVTSECDAIKSRFRKRGIENIKHYVLLTNVPFSPSLRQKIQDLLKQAVPHCKISLWGSEDLCAMLDNAPNIRIAFPQIMGLRDLRELLASVVEKPILERSTLSLDRAAELAQVFVPTEAYSKALATLAEYSFVVITGPPEMGKTTIARIIGLAKLGEGWECYECRKPDDFLQVMRSDRRQIFIADDAFGSTEFRPDIAQTWAADLDNILRALGKKHWFIWTSRPAQLNLALKRMHLQGKAEDFPKPAKILVDASTLTQEEKVLILYRHAKAAGLSEAAKQLVRSHSRAIVNNNHFTPERIRHLISNRLKNFTDEAGKLSATHSVVDEAIVSEINEPTKSMKQSFEVLDSHHQRFLIAMLDTGEGPVVKERVHAAFKRHSDGYPEVNPAHIADDLSAHFIRQLDAENA